MNASEAFFYTWMVLLWVFGIAVTPFGWLILLEICFPPVAWVMAFKWMAGV